MTLEEENRLAEIEKRANAAERGPWECVTMWIPGNGDEIDAPLPNVITLRDANGAVIHDCPIHDWANAEFVSAARADVPWLVALVREQARAIENLTDGL